MPTPKKRPTQKAKSPRKAPEQLDFFEVLPEAEEALAVVPLDTEAVPLAEPEPASPSPVAHSSTATRGSAAPAERKELTPLEVDRLLQAARFSCPGRFSRPCLATCGSGMHRAPPGIGCRTGPASGAWIMCSPEGRVRVHLCGQPVDMSKSYEGLYALTRRVLQQNPFSKVHVILYGTPLCEIIR